MILEDEPHAKRRGWLKNGNIPGDFLLASKCGARTRSSHSCLSPAMKNGRCRMHGGKSTGPKTREGLEKSRRARWKNGFYSQKLRQERKQLRDLFKNANCLIQKMEIA